MLYPLLFHPNLKTLVWGSEEWTVSTIPGSESVVANGEYAGRKLTEVVGELPLLTKIIDARQDLSIQVHPDDEMAMREHNKSGKSEMWYILAAEPGAYLYAGFREHITPYEYKHRVADGSITEVLARHEVKKGDVFYLPAGRIHAICGGIRLVEVQQSSDVTYRIYDYNRLGLDGLPRQLHTELAAQAIDYEVYPEYKTEHRETLIDDVDKILNTPYFSIKLVETSRPYHRNMIKYESFIILMNLGSQCSIRSRITGDEVPLATDVACFMPANIADYDIIPSTGVGGGPAKVLEAFINNKKTIGKSISDFFHLS